MDRLENRPGLAQVRPRNDPESSDEASAKVTHHVAIEILHQEHVKAARILNQAHAARVDDQGLELNLRELVSMNLLRTSQEESVGELHDVCLVKHRHPLSPAISRIAERPTRDAQTSNLRGNLEARDDSWSDLIFHSAVEPLGVFAHDHQVDIRIPARHTGKIAHRADGRVQVQLPAQFHIDGSEAFPNRRRTRPLQRNARMPNRFERALGKDFSTRFEGRESGEFGLPTNRCTGRFENLLDSLRHLRPDTVPGDQDDVVAHASRIPCNCGVDERRSEKSRSLPGRGNFPEALRAPFQNGRRGVTPLGIMSTPTTERDCDVLVIGGGPAGSTAGHLLARGGHDVVVLERERFPRFHIGESLLPANMPLLECLGVREEIEAARSVPKHGANIFAASGSPSVNVRFDHGLVPCAPNAFQVVRSTFDDILLRASRRAGADVLEEHRAVSASRSDEHWEVQVETSTKEKRCIRARYLVDASGRDTFLAVAQRSKKMAEGHRRAALFAHFRGVESHPDVPTGNLLMTVRRDGWLWAIPLADGTTSIGLVVQGDALRRFGGSTEEALNHAIEHTPVLSGLVKNAERITPVHGASNYSYASGAAAEQGALKIGDAMAFLDPVFSTGVWLAMQGGERAASVLDECLRHPKRADRLLRQWSRRQEKSVRYYWRLIEAFYRAEFIDLFLQPSRAPIFRSLVPALNSVFAGMGPGSIGLRMRIAVFTALQAAQRRFGITNRLSLGSVFED